MSAPSELHNLVERFTRNHARLREPSYKEAQLRVDFLNPLFDLLGWDLTNKQGLSEQKREVITEDRLLIDGRSKAPDYSFGLGGERKFFVEAKKPSVDLSANWEPAYQLRTYAWTATLPVSLLTDFEELAIYDCRIEPRKLDKPTVARIDYFGFDQLIERWDWFSNLFHRDAVAAGSLEEYAKELPKKRGVLSFDAAFLKELEEWRELLATDIAKRNHSLDAATLTDAVQRMIDRILFLRFAEDRGIEQYGVLKTLHKEKGIYGKLFDIFQTADRRYNSGLFHFRKERGRGGDVDTVAGALQVGDEPLKRIISRLYYPDSPYAFSVIPADILGQVYEQFLGKVITLGARHSVKVEEKPEVRKAGGVFYTPTWVVREIVRRTIGRTFEGKTPEEMEEFRALDPACGSGSFLLGAFDELLSWHRDYYARNQPKKWEKAGRIIKTEDNYRLSVEEKKRVLRMLYGVDIDRQAVEVTKLSLLLKLLEEENAETLQAFGVMDRILPDLDDRIVCGNSLIGYDVIDDEYLSLSSEDQQRINPFDWEGTFPFLKNGGFDCVIGNPPYVLVQNQNIQFVFDYLSNSYGSAKYKLDLYHLFIEKSIKICVDGGRIGLITPNTYFRNKHSKELRRIILNNTTIEYIANYYFSVFYGASVDTSTIIMQKIINTQHIVSIELCKGKDEHQRSSIFVLQENWKKHNEYEISIQTDNKSIKIIDKFKHESFRLGDIATAYFGIQTFDRKIYVDSQPKTDQWKPCIDGIDIGRYKISNRREYVCTEVRAIKSGGKQEVYEQQRIVVRQIGDRPIGTIIKAGIYTLNTIYNIFMIKETQYNYEYLLGIISSSSFAWYWQQVFGDNKKTFPKIKKNALLESPIPKIDFKSKSNVDHYKMLISLVERMLTLHKKQAEAKTAHEKTNLTRQIEATDQQIDKLVYELYGLTEEEIEIVEKK